MARWRQLRSATTEHHRCTQQAATSDTAAVRPDAASGTTSRSGFRTQEVATLKQQLSVAQEQIRELQSQLANAKNQGVKDFFAQAEERHKELENRGKGRPAEEGSKSMIRIEPDVRERIELLRKAVPGTSLTRFLNQAAREKLKDIFSDPQYRTLLFDEE